MQPHHQQSQEYIKKILGPGNTTILIMSNDEIEDIIEIVKSLENSGLLLKGVTETVWNEVKEQKAGILPLLLGTLGAWKARGINRAGEGIVGAGYGNKMDF